MRVRRTIDSFTFIKLCVSARTIRRIQDVTELSALLIEVMENVEINNSPKKIFKKQNKLVK